MAEIVKVDKKLGQSIVDKILFTLPDGERRIFYKMCQFNANYSDLQAFLEERSEYQVDIPVIARWFKYNRPVGRQAVILNQILDDWEGINPNSLIHLSAGITAKLVLAIDTLLEQDLPRTSPATRLTNLVELLKELRQTSAELKRLDQEKDTGETYKAGMIALAHELNAIFKGTPLQVPVQNALNASIDKLSNSQ